MTIRPEVLIIAAGAVVAGLLLTGKNAGAAGSAFGGAAVDLVDGAVSGTIFAIGERVGLSDTRAQSVTDQGQAELAAGNYWDASFHLPAGDFIAGTWRRLTN